MNNTAATDNLRDRITTAVAPDVAIAGWVWGRSYEDRLIAVVDSALAYRETFVLVLDETDGTWAMVNECGEVEGDGLTLAQANEGLDEMTLEFARSNTGIR